MTFYDLYPHFHRASNFWEGVNAKRVALYLKSMIKMKKHLEHSYTLMDREFKGKIMDAINGEIALCKFYFEWRQKQKRDDFNKWVFLKTNNNERWTKYNGKIRATIDITDNITSTKIQLYIENDSKHQEFFYNGYYGGRKEICHKNLRKKESIDKYTQQLKDYVDTELIKKYEYPYYCQERADFLILRQLLHVDMESEEK